PAFTILPFFSMHPPPPTPTLLPYTTLFRSQPRTAPVGKNLQHRPPSSGSRLLNPAAVPAAGLISKKGMKTVNNLLDEYTSLTRVDRKSTRLNSSHRTISYAVFCLKKKKQQT